MLVSSAIIQDIEKLQKAGSASLAFFYFDSTEVHKKDRRELLSSLLVQLCHQTDSYRDILSSFYAAHSNGVQNPGNDALVGCLKELLSVQRQGQVFLILDGLDKCSNTGLPSPREEVLILLKELINSKFPHLYICVTSRPEKDIQSVLVPLASQSHSISLHDESGHKDDIDNYIKFFVNKNLNSWSIEDKGWVVNVLSEQADGR
jgi:NACHT domain